MKVNCLKPALADFFLSKNASEVNICKNVALVGPICCSVMQPKIF